MAQNAKNRHSPLLTSLTDALATIDRTVEPVEPRELELDAAVGFTLAADGAIASESGAATALRLTGARLRRVDRALLEKHGVVRASIRAPRVLIAGAHPSDAVFALIRGAIEAEGGSGKTASGTLEAILRQENFDAVIAIGNGDARDDASVRTLSGAGTIAFDGVALKPGGAIAFGNVGTKPVLVLPGHIEAALAAWLAIGRRLLARLAFRLIEEQPFLLELARPITSARGLAEIVPVRRRAAQVEPLIVETWTAQTITRSDGWILVPAESEGHSAGTRVAMRPWP